jgi:hypothetical protein
MPAVAVFIVLLSIGTILLYGLQAARTRLGQYSQDHALAQAAAAANTIEKANPGEVEEAASPVRRAGRWH